VDEGRWSGPSAVRQHCLGRSRNSESHVSGSGPKVQLNGMAPGLANHVGSTGRGQVEIGEAWGCDDEPWRAWTGITGLGGGTLEVGQW